MRKISPNSDKQYVNSINLNNSKVFPKFLKNLTFDKFRHITNLTINFQHPISIISGTNRSGKSTILMALACSHYYFLKRNPHNGILERQTWSSLMRFTSKDIQNNDWTYYITYKLGDKIEQKRGQRKSRTRKWNGIGKKEAQFKFKKVIFLDLDRTLPARYYSNPLFNRTKKQTTTAISSNKAKEIEEYISYILEESFTLTKIASHLDKDIFSYQSNYNHGYSSYNAATGEEVLIKMIIDIAEAENESLILIDEIEVGLHPKIQRRFMDILFYIARHQYKQIIISTHSPTILSCVPNKARIFLNKTPQGQLECLQGISINRALSLMDSTSYPLVNFFCEDDLAKKIIEYAVNSIHQDGTPDIKKMINIIILGASKDTYNCYLAHKNTFESKYIKSGYACILDGDMRNEEPYKNDCDIFFLLQDKDPETTLVSHYESICNNRELNYHIQHSNNHCLFKKMVELNIFTKEEDAIRECIDLYFKSNIGQPDLISLIHFITLKISFFSNQL